MDFWNGLGLMLGGAGVVYFMTRWAIGDEHKKRERERQERERLKADGDD